MGNCAYIYKDGDRISRGGTSTQGSKDGVFITNEKREIITTWRQTGSSTKNLYMKGYIPGYYEDEVLEAETDGAGNVTFYKADGEFEGEWNDGNRRKKVTYNLQAGAINGATFNIDWDKVKSISGNTYPVKDAAKKAGLKWNRDTKRWERP